MASFSNDVRGEICCTVTDKDKKYACLYGIILFCRHISEKSVTINTESEKFFKLSCELIKSVFNRNIIFETEIIQKKKGNTGYYININDADSVRLIYEAYNINIEKREINLKNIVINSLNAFLAGVFLICGSVIEDILTFIGARQCTLNLMNIKIFKDVRNKVNRIANCDAANIDKVIAASAKQINDIKIIKNADKFEDLSAELKETANLRLLYPEYSLQELGDNLSKPIGRSGVNRRFLKLAVIADEIIKKDKDGENIGN